MRGPVPQPSPTAPAHSQTRSAAHLPSAVTFDVRDGLKRVHVITPAATATIYLQGAHLTAWQPAGFGPVIFLSPKSTFAAGKPIRGGIPIVFPWFSADKKNRLNGRPGPMHGFARTQEWSLESASRKASAIELKLTLGPTETSRSMGFDKFRLELTFRITHTLTVALKVINQSDQPMEFEEGLHSYFHVTDIHEVTVTGLEAAKFIEKSDGAHIQPASGAPITFTDVVDRIYPDTAATCIVHDEAGKRRISIQKSGSHSTIVWNPWREMPDLGPWDWHNMVAVETANVGADALTLKPGESHTMQAIISVAKA